MSSTIQLGKAFVSTADDMSMLTSRLSLVTNGTSELNTVQKELLTTSNDTRVALQSTSALYTQLGRSTQSLELSSQYLLDVTKTINQTLTISGASAQSANAALFQLSQGLGAGALRGEELNSVLEQTPRLAQAIADGMGVSIAQLRQLGSEGALTAEKVLGALKSQASTVNSEFAGIAVTAQGGYTVLQNTIDSTIGKLDKQHGISISIGQTFMALGKVISTELTDAFDRLTGNGIKFGDLVGQGVVQVIKILGSAYDSFETLGDYFAVVGALGKVAFGGLATAFNGVATGIVKTFESVIDGINFGFETMVNGAIAGINILINAANMLPNINIGNVGYIDLGNIDLGGNYLADATSKSLQFTEEALAELVTAKDALLQTGDGAKFADNIASSFEKSFETIRKETENNNGSYSPTSNSNEKENKLVEENNQLTNETIENIINTNKTLDSTNETLDNTSEATKDFSDILYNNKDSAYKAINDTIDTTDDFTNSVNNLDYGIEKTTESLENFIFQFSNTLFNALETNADKLRQIGQSTAFNSISYSKALYEASNAKNELIANPLSATIGEAYTTAYNNFISSASDYLDPSNFRSIEEFRFAQSTVGTQANQLESTASSGASVLDSMNSLLSAINTALSDGILTDEENIALINLSSEVTSKNEELLGKNSGLVSTVNGLYKGEKIDVGNLTTDYMKDKTFSDNGLTKKELNTAELYTGGDINATVNTISGFALDTSLTKDGGLKVDNAIPDVSGLMKNKTFSDNGLTSTQLTEAGLYAGEDINAQVNTIDGYAKNETFTSTNGLKVNNTVADVSSLMKDKTFTAYESVALKDSNGNKIDPMQDDTFTSYDEVKVSNQITGYYTDQNANDLAKLEVGVKEQQEKNADERTGKITTAADTSKLATTDDLVGSTSFITTGLNQIPITISAQEYYNNSLLAKDQTLSDLDLDTTTLAKSTDLVGSNSVSDYVQGLMGGGTSGISLNKIASTLPALSVATGLDVSDLTSISSSTATQATELGRVSGNTATTANVVSNLGKVPIGTAMVTSVPVFGTKEVWNNVWQQYSASVPDYNNVVGYKDVVKYWDGSSYLAKGGFAGFTGKGSESDFTGEKQTVLTQLHEDEWVAPRWMVQGNRGLFNSLESARQSGNMNSLASGGYVQPSFNVNATMSDSGAMSEMQKDIKELKMILANVTENGNLMNVRIAG